MDNVCACNKKSERRKCSVIPNDDKATTATTTIPCRWNIASLALTLKKISNHPNSPSSLQKLLGKSSVPCHISHIYQDAAQPITSEGLSNYLLAQWPRRDTLQAADSCLRRNKAIFRDAAAQAKANYGEHNAGFSRALTEWMARS